MIKKLLLTVLFVAVTPTQGTADDNDISALYASAGVEGTLLVESLDGDDVFVHNAPNVDKGYIPASTFKIPNTLIALEEGVVRSQSEIIPWDGVERGYAPWNSDQTLATAFARSCVWCYQRFATEIGDEKYRTYLDAFEYGNRKTGENIRTFWLEGDLRISVRDQVNFLRKVYLGILPVKPGNIGILKDIMLARETPAYRLGVKTGWKGEHGWYVGYVETDDEVWLFANYIEIRDETDLALRESLTLDALKLKGIIQD